MSSWLIMILTFFIIAVGVYAIAEGWDPNLGGSRYQSVKDRCCGRGGQAMECQHCGTRIGSGTAEARHVHPGAELVYVLEGAGSLEVDPEWRPKPARA
jgi:hypothetical protein